MILVTKLNDTPVLLNLETVKYLEQTPDTLIFFANGDSMIVKESFQEIQNKVIEHQAEIIKKAQNT